MKRFQRKHLKVVSSIYCHYLDPFSRINCYMLTYYNGENIKTNAHMLVETLMKEVLL